MIKNIVFDMGNVLIPFRPMEFVQPFVADPADRELILTELFEGVEWIQLDRGSLTEAEVAASVCRRLPQRLWATVDTILGRWHTLLRDPFPDMEALVGELKAAGYGIYLLSNCGRSFYTFRKQIPALRFFDGLFISADFQLLKPSEEVFRRFLREFSLAAEECFFIDDSRANIEGALWMGIPGFLYRRNTDALRAALKDAGVSF